MVVPAERRNSPVVDWSSLEDAGGFIGGAASGAGTVGVLGLLAAGYRSLFSDSSAERKDQRGTISMLWDRVDEQGDKIDAQRGELDQVHTKLRECEQREHAAFRRDQLRQGEIDELRAQLDQRGPNSPHQPQ